MTGQEAAKSTDELSQLKSATLEILKAYTKKERSPTVGFEPFVEYLKAYVRRFSGKHPRLAVFSGDARFKVIRALRSLAEAGVCEIQAAGTAIDKLVFPRYYVEAVREVYRHMEESPDRPFPSEADLQLTLPPEAVTTANISSGLEDITQQAERASLMRLLFPEGGHTILVPPELFPEGLLDFAIAKIRHYLSQAANMNFVQSRMNAVFRSNQSAVTDMVNTIAVKPVTARKTVQEASDFHFRFWGHLVSLLTGESRSAASSDDDHGHWSTHQAAHIIGMYNVSYRNRTQEQQNTLKGIRKALDAQFARAPYIYALRDLHAMKDGAGRPLFAGDSRQVLLDYLRDKLRPATGRAVPELIRLRTGDRQDYFVPKNMLVPILLKQIPETSNALEAHYIQSWQTALRSRKRLIVMKDDTAFQRDLERRVEFDHPLVHQMLNAQLLAAIQREVRLTGNITLGLSRIMDSRSGSIRPLPEVFELSRATLLRTVKNMVPLWARVPVVADVMAFFKRLFSGGARNGGNRAADAESNRLANRQEPGKKVLGPPTGRAPAAPSKRATLKQRHAVHRRAVEELKEHFMGSDGTLAQGLSDLIDRWNPIVDEKARADLVEDVDSMIRTFMRGILRKGVEPPNSARIASMASRLSENPSFDRIRRKDVFRRYIELYMVKVLAEQHSVSL